MRFAGKVAVVTGGGRDIGRACALRLAREGAALAINYFESEAGANQTVSDIVSAGGRAFAMQGDMTRPADVAAFVDRAAAEFGRIDVAIANTGGLLARRLLPEISLEHWQSVFEVNVTSAMLLIRACVPHMKAGGAIVTLGSQAGRDGGGPGAVPYGMAKGAIMSMTRGFAKELAPAIRVNAMCPGLIDTNFHDTFTKPEIRRKVAEATPLKREGTAEEVADLAAFLASDEAAFMTGACVDLNGGTVFN